MRLINQGRDKFSGKQKLLKGYWNPYLMMSDKSRYAHYANPYI